MNAAMPSTGESVLNAFKADVESFFDSKYQFQLRVEEGGLSPVCKGSGAKARIILPKDLLEKPIRTVEDMVFLLIVLGHETAHYLNRHNEHKDECAVETRAIEMWADFFGTKVALVTMTFGENVQMLGEKLPGWEESGGRIDALAAALATLSNTYFKIKHQSYPPVQDRVSTCIAGALSFFQNLYPLQALLEHGDEEFRKASHPVTIMSRNIGLQMRIYKNKDLENLALTSETLDSNSEQIRTISEVHKSIQAEHCAMFNGMAEIPAIWLNLNYDVPENERQKIVENKMQAVEDTLDSLGMNSSSFD